MAASVSLVDYKGYRKSKKQAKKMLLQVIAMYNSVSIFIDIIIEGNCEVLKSSKAVADTTSIIKFAIHTRKMVEELDNVIELMQEKVNEAEEVKSEYHLGIRIRFLLERNKELLELVTNVRDEIKQIHDEFDSVIDKIDEYLKTQDI